MNPAVAAEWTRCRHWLLPALHEHTEAQLIEELTSGEAQIWGARDGAIVTQLLNADEPLVMLWLGGGNMQSLIALLPGIEAWGRAHGAKALWIKGRKGWARALKSAGFEPVGEELRREL